jgi:hypothetical protein
MNNLCSVLIIQKKNPLLKFPFIFFEVVLILNLRLKQVKIFLLNLFLLIMVKEQVFQHKIQEIDHVFHLLHLRTYFSFKMFLILYKNR